MEILTGLLDHMVLQRDSRNLSDADVTGRCAGSGEVFARVTRKGKVVAGFAACKVGAARRGKFTAQLKGLAAGGPYDIELSIAGKGGAAEKLRVKDVLVGDVWILGGQSNMQGCAWIENPPKPDPLVRAFYMQHKWAVAQDPIHNLDAAVDKVHADLSGGALPPKVAGFGAGPGVPFGQAMRKLTGVPQGVIACAHGGTSMSQWDPAGKKLGSASLYGAMLGRFIKNGGKVAGVAWYQGCSDANPEAAPLYTKRMKRLVAATRRDFRSPRLPWVIVQISRVTNVTADAEWNSIQEQQRKLPRAIKNLAVVPAIDLPLSDPIHVNCAGHIRLGKRLADAMGSLKHTARPPIELKKISLRRDARTGQADVVIQYANVVGSLQAPALASGFELRDGGSYSFVYRTDLRGNRVILKTEMQPADQVAKYLWYGRTCNPLCNITDSADRSLPVMGPIPLRSEAAVTPFVQEFAVSPIMPLEGGMALLGYSAPADLAMEKRKFTQQFASRHEEISAAGGRDAVVYYACSIECPEAMKLNVSLGYDGPIKMWVDGKEVFADLDGTNPAIPDRSKVEVDAAPGRHDLLVALGANKGRAWGIFMRFQRTDLPRRLIVKGPGAYVMPAII